MASYGCSASLYLVVDICRTEFRNPLSQKTPGNRSRQHMFSRQSAKHEPCSWRVYQRNIAKLNPDLLSSTNHRYGLNRRFAIKYYCHGLIGRCITDDLFFVFQMKKRPRAAFPTDEQNTESGGSLHLPSQPVPGHVETILFHIKKTTTFFRLRDLVQILVIFHKVCKYV